MRFNRTRTLVGALLLAAGLTLPAGAAQTITVRGTTNLAPMVTAAAADYRKANPGVAIDVKGNSSGAGIASCRCLSCGEPSGGA